MRQQEWPDNAHKKLITEQNFDDRAIHRAIMPMQISHQGFQIPGPLINSFLSPFMSGYSNYNTILRNFPQPQPFNRIEYFNPDPLSSVSRPRYLIKTSRIEAISKLSSLRINIIISHRINILIPHISKSVLLIMKTANSNNKAN